MGTFQFVCEKGDVLRVFVMSTNFRDLSAEVFGIIRVLIRCVFDANTFEIRDKT